MDKEERTSSLASLSSDNEQTASQTEEGIDVAACVSTTLEVKAGPVVVAVKEQDPNLVGWNGPDDAENPLNWAASRKWLIVALVSAISFTVPLAGSIFAPGVPQLMREFGSDSKLLASFTVSVFLLGFVCGPLVVAPMSELYGRLPAYHVSNIIFVAFSIGCALSTNLAMFCVFRLLMGIAGSTPMTVGGGSIADLIPQQERGKALAIWALGPLLGPAIGPVIGGFVTEYAGWRWVFWILAIVSGVLTIVSFILMRETYGPVILARRCKALRVTTKNEALHTAYDGILTPSQLFRKAIVRPMKMLTRSSIVFLMSLHVAINFSYLYLMFTTFTYVFEQRYAFSPAQSGLSFLGIGIGMLLGLLICGNLSDRIMKKKAASNGGVLKPEFRLPLMLPASILVPAGLFWYGWSAQAGVHWIVPIIGTSLVGIGLLGIFMPVQTYFVDAFTVHAASALAANTVLRSLFGAFIPLAGQDLYHALGLGWGNSLLAFIALLMLPVPIFFLRYGERMRQRTTVTF